MNIEVKSPGMLIDELVTAKIKVHFFQAELERERWAEARARCGQLVVAIDKAIGGKEVGHAIDGLVDTVIKCFIAQENLFAHSKANEKVEAGESAMEVHHLNAQRNNWIRVIDGLLGAKDVTQLEKTYE